MIRAERTTEVRITLTSSQGGDTRVTLSSGGIKQLSASVELEGGVSTELRLPIQPSIRQPLDITLSQNGKVIASAQENGHSLITSTYVIAATDPSTIPTEKEMAAHRPQEYLSNDIYFLNSPSEALPSSSQAYQAIDALILDSTSLQHLSSQQLDALYGYLQWCGRLIAVDLNTTQLNQLRRQSTCGLTSLANPDASLILEHVGALLSATPQKPVQPLLHNDQDEHALYRNVILFFVFYIAVLLIIAKSLPRPLALVSAPLFFSLLALLTWHNASSGTAAGSGVIEMENGSDRGRFQGTISVTGNGRGHLDITLPTDLLGTTGYQGPLNTHYHYRTPDTVTISHMMYLFSTFDIPLQGIIRDIPAITLEDRAEGPIVINRSSLPISGGFLTWKAAMHTLPPLKPGEQWSPSAETAAPFPGELAALLNTPVTTLALPYVPAGVDVTGSTSFQGWLVIRAKGETS